MSSRTSSQFTKTITLSDNAMQNPAIITHLRRGQWVAYNGARGQFIGVDYNNVIYVAWYQRGMTMQQRNAKLRNLTIAFLNIITNQEIAQQRRDARALQLATIRHRIARMLSFVLSILQPTYKRLDVATRATMNNLRYINNGGQIFLYERDANKRLVWCAFDSKPIHQFLDEYAQSYNASPFID